MQHHNIQHNNKMRHLCLVSSITKLIILSVIMLNAVTLIDMMLNVVMLRAILLSVIILSVLMLDVFKPKNWRLRELCCSTYPFN